MSFAEHARSLVSFNEWANDRILTAAEACTRDQFAQVRDTLTHLLGTQIFWRRLWNGEGADGIEDYLRERTGNITTPEQLWSAFAQSHDDMRAFVTGLDDPDWHRSNKWWRPYSEAELPLGDSIVQVINHGTQHRSEVALRLTGFGHSPGDLDYLNFKLPDAQ
jgi:uncharacterized damage-inducible protein DinB